MQKKLLSAAAVVLGLLSGTAQAHFQLVYTPQVQLDEPQTVPVKLVFWHPMENGHVMDMELPEAFYYVFKGEKTDLLKTLKPMTFKGQDNQAQGFETEVKIRRNGDYVFVLQPAPYFEKSENAYIQQITKSYLNKGDLPDAWHEPLGLATEIVPFNKPTNILAGSTFTGQVLSDGKPAAGVEIEIEYMAAPPDIKANRASSNRSTETKGGTLVAVSDANGMFTFGIPKEGFWGFAALGSGSKTEYQGKELSQDAVIWIRADKME
ncbi:MAG: DUF4198 domain-containing protein [Neisseria sp.]|nr:DUF4198 domain-containing protein [Neisseria sp.]